MNFADVVTGLNLYLYSFGCLCFEKCCLGKSEAWLVQMFRLGVKLYPVIEVLSFRGLVPFFMMEQPKHSFLGLLMLSPS